MRLKVLEEGLKAPATTRRLVSADDSPRSAVARRKSTGSEDAAKAAGNGNRLRRPSVLQTRASFAVSTMFKNGKLSNSFDGGRSVEGGFRREKQFVNSLEDFESDGHRGRSASELCDATTGNPVVASDAENSKEFVSSLLYDTLQKEVIMLRKASHEKDQGLKDKDDAIEASVVSWCYSHLKQVFLVVLVTSHHAG